MAFDLTKFRPDEADEFIELVMIGVEAISMLVGGYVAGPVTTAIRAIIDSLQAAYDGTVSFDQVRAELSKLTAGIESNDIRADAALQQKFNTGDTEED